LSLHSIPTWTLTSKLVPSWSIEGGCLGISRTTDTIEESMSLKSKACYIEVITSLREPNTTLQLLTIGFKFTQKSWLL